MAEKELLPLTSAQTLPTREAPASDSPSGGPPAPFNPPGSDSGLLDTSGNPKVPPGTEEPPLRADPWATEMTKLLTVNPVAFWAHFDQMSNTSETPFQNREGALSLEGVPPDLRAGVLAAMKLYLGVK